jgi:hypothetical protein
MRSAVFIGLLCLIGCNREPSADIKARASELSSGFKQHADALDSLSAQNQIYSESIIGKQDETLTALAAIKSQIEALKVESETANSQEVIKSALEPQEPERDSQNTPSIPVSAPAVHLQFYTQARCSDCTIQEPNAEAAADELGVTLEVFDLRKHDEAFEQAKITVTPTTVIVISDKIRVRFVGVVSSSVIAARVKQELSGTNAVVSRARNTNAVVSHNDLVSIHNRLHGGGNWTWPGDLATHLQTVHGVDPDGIPANYRTGEVASQRSSVRLVSRGSPRGWRTSYQARGTCPSGGCP